MTLARYTIDVLKTGATTDDTEDTEDTEVTKRKISLCSLCALCALCPLGSHLSSLQPSSARPLRTIDRFVAHRKICGISPTKHRVRDIVGLLDGLHFVMQTRTMMYAL